MLHSGALNGQKPLYQIHGKNVSVFKKFIIKFKLGHRYKYTLKLLRSNEGSLVDDLLSHKIFTLLHISRSPPASIMMHDGIMWEMHAAKGSI